ncbi:MAG: pyrimidine dimer DNA glycosylase/endonuclease V [Candidatus Bathyarchaeia archaeon]
MRLWMVDPHFLCKFHLLGEHGEIHMFVGALEHGHSVEGYVDKGLLEVHGLFDRHEELVIEMVRRSYNHNSPLDEKWKRMKKQGFIDREKSLRELIGRCSRCRERYIQYGKEF